MTTFYSEYKTTGLIVLFPVECIIAQRLIVTYNGDTPAVSCGWQKFSDAGDAVGFVALCQIIIIMKTAKEKVFEIGLGVVTSKERC